MFRALVALLMLGSLSACGGSRSAPERGSERETPEPAELEPTPEEALAELVAETCVPPQDYVQDVGGWLCVPMHGLDPLPADARTALYQEIGIPAIVTEDSQLLTIGAATAYSRIAQETSSAELMVVAHDAASLAFMAAGRAPERLRHARGLLDVYGRGNAMLDSRGFVLGFEMPPGYGVRDSAQTALRFAAAAARYAEARRLSDMATWNTIPTSITNRHVVVQTMREREAQMAEARVALSELEFWQSPTWEAAAKAELGAMYAAYADELRAVEVPNVEQCAIDTGDRAACQVARREYDLAIGSQIDGIAQQAEVSFSAACRVSGNRALHPDLYLFVEGVMHEWAGDARCRP